ncbi:MAG: hypothetical protein M1821_007063 [Bathelium mastoideum]|nr:MAG: hypothetical protein M1821_007063 [Bathelium mastoideum]
MNDNDELAKASVSSHSLPFQTWLGDANETPLDTLKARLSRWDPNLPDDYKLQRLSSISALDEDKVGSKDEVEEDSPYPEVRAAVPNFDDDVPANTVRAWVLGLSLAAMGASVNTIFSLRQPAISLGTIVAQLLSYFLGVAWAKFIPSRQLSIFGLRWNTNPGRFNVKEHSLIVIMANVSFGTAYATDIILAQVGFFKQNFGIPFQLLLVISTQSLGYGIAGLMRNFLVYPAGMIWPVNLVSTTLIHAMHEKNEKPDPTIIGGKMSRYKWFGLVFLGAYLWYFVPGFLAQFLSIFAFATWIAPQNAVVNQLFGGTTGLSILPITFDWTQISGFVGSPLIPPWHAIANTMIGVVVFYIFTTAGLHYSGARYSKFLPMSDSQTYDNTGQVYDVTRIVTSQLTLNEAAYKAYSPLFLSTTFAMSYGLSFATVASLIVYTYLHHGGQILAQFQNSRGEAPDIHMKLMSRYKEAPQWWYGVLFLLMMVLSLITVLAFPTNFEWWAFLIAVLVSTAITNVQIGLNVLTEFIMGYMQPGKPLALMMFKTYGYITMSQALSFVSDLKFGHYMKIPPRTMFSAQVVATTMASIIQVLVLNFALKNIEGICTLEQEQHFSCPGGRVFFSASVIWGLLGPSRIFSPGQIYTALFWFFPIGLATPVIFWLVVKRWPASPIKYLNAPLIFGGSGSIPPATPLNYLSWGAVGFVFQKYIRTRHFGWWSRLNYLTASGLDTGLAFSTLTIFLAFTLNNIAAPKWWGNDIVSVTMDAQDTAIQAHVAPGQFFGPRAW